MVILRGMAALAALAASTVLAFAGTACYTASDIAAEQAMKYQTELMVYSDTCSQGNAFTNFLLHNKTAIAEYQHQMVERYRSAGIRGAETTFDNYLTYLANQVSLLIDGLPTDSFCSGKERYFAEAETLNSEGLRHLVEARAIEHEKEYVRCPAKSAVNQ